MKNVIIGIDGCSFNQITPLINEGVLPNFEKLIKFGFSANLKVSKPPVTIPSFPCIFSGLSVTDLGKCSFYHPDYGIFSSHFWKEQSIFSIGKMKTFCLNLPSTYPAWDINGEMITGVLSPEINEKMVSPNHLFDLIKNDWIIDGMNVEDIFKAFELKRKVFLKKLSDDFELLVYIIRMPDVLTHHPGYKIKITKKLLKEAYEKIDSFIGDILERRDLDNLFIVSDHGLEIYPNQFSVTKFLEKNKILYYNNGDTFFKILSIFIKVFGYFNPKFIDIKYFHNKFKKIFKNLGSKRSLSVKDATRFEQYYSNYGGIFLKNLDKQIKGKIKEILLKSRYIDDVMELGQNFLPDLMIKLKKGYLFSVRGSHFIKTQFNSYNHIDNGVFIAYGKNIISGKEVLINYESIAPSLLKLYGSKKPDYMKGTILEYLKY